MSVVKCLSILTLSASAPAMANEKTNSVLTDFSIREVDKPPYTMYPYEGAENLKRFNQAHEVFAIWQINSH